LYHIICKGKDFSDRKALKDDKLFIPD